MKNQNELPQKNKRGGARPGAGRPKTQDNCKSIALRIPQDVADILDRQDNRSAYIIEAIRAYDKAQRKRTILGIEISYTTEPKPKD